MSRKETWVCASLLLALSTQAGHAQDLRAAAPDAAAPQPDLNSLRQQVAAQAIELAKQQRQLDEMQHKIKTLQQQVGTLLADSAPPEKVAGPVHAVTLAQSSGMGSQDAAPNPANPVGQAPEPRHPGLDVATVFSEPSILTPRGKFVFEPSLQYAYSASDRVSVVGYSVLNAVLIGEINVSSVNDSTWIATLGGRYGLTDRLEVEAQVPYVYRMDNTVSRPITGSSFNELLSSHGNDLGDVQLAARYQLNMPRGNDPYYIAGLRFKTRTGTDQFEVPYDATFNLPTRLPTGSGFYSLQPSFTAVLASDPAVFFGGINYTWNIKRNVNTSIPYDNGTTIVYTPIGEVDPGDSVGVNFGMGMAINERSSFSLSYEHSWVGKTSVGGLAAPSNVSTSVQLATLQLGLSYRLNKRSSLNLSIGAGLTPDTPGTTVTLRVPITF